MKRKIIMLLTGVMLLMQNWQAHPMELTEGIFHGYYITNPTKQRIGFRTQRLSLVFLTANPMTNEKMGYHDPENRSYWYYLEHNPLTIKDRIEFGSIAAHEINFPSSPQELFGTDKKLSTSKDPMLPIVYLSHPKKVLA